MGGLKCGSATHQNYRMCLGGDGDGVKQRKKKSARNSRITEQSTMRRLESSSVSIMTSHGGTEIPRGVDCAAGCRGMTSKRATSCKEKSKEGGVTGAGEDK